MSPGSAAIRWVLLEFAETSAGPPATHTESLLSVRPPRNCAGVTISDLTCHCQQCALRVPRHANTCSHIIMINLHSRTHIMITASLADIAVVRASYCTQPLPRPLPMPPYNCLQI